MPSDAFTQTKTALLDLGGQRVWSLMVTLFGDLAQAEGDKIEGPTLSAIMAEMDVRPEAVRVALHRLRNDGWITSEKSGRTGSHALTPKGRSETTEASARIYASPTSALGHWQLAITADTPEQMKAPGFVQLLPRVYLGSANATAPPEALSLSGGTAPDWLRAEIAPLMLEHEYAALLTVLRKVEQTIAHDTLTPLHKAVLRCLLVHNWRRIVLRHPTLPPALLPDDWSGHACHHLIDTLLSRFPRPDLHLIRPA